MKKIYLLLLAFIIASSCIAQVEHYLGVRGGYGMLTAGFTPYRQTKSTSGTNMGITYKFYTPDASSLLSKHMGTQLELNYAQRGYKHVVDESTDTTFLANAIEFPAITQGFVKIGPARLFACFGVFGSFILDKEFTVTDASGTTKAQAYEFNRRDNRWEYGILFGGGLGFEIAKTIELQGEFRYQYMLSRIRKPRFHGQKAEFGNYSIVGGSIGIFYKF